MKKYLLTGVFVLCLSFICLNFVGSASASSFGQGVSTTAQKVDGLNTQRTLTDMAVIATQGFLSLVGIIFLVLIIYGGFNWMTAAGEDEKITKAKKTFTAATIGLLLIVSGQIITYFIAQQLETPGAGYEPTSNPICEDPGYFDYYSVDCCEYRYQVTRTIEPQCCTYSPYCRNHQTECIPILPGATVCP